MLRSSSFRILPRVELSPHWEVVAHVAGIEGRGAEVADGVEAQGSDSTSEILYAVWWSLHISIRMLHLK